VGIATGFAVSAVICRKKFAALSLQGVAHHNHGDHPCVYLGRQPSIMKSWILTSRNEVGMRTSRNLKTADPLTIAVIVVASLSYSQTSAQAVQSGLNRPRMETQSAQAEAQRHVEKANALRDKKDIAGEISELREAIRVKPDFPEAHLNLGLALFSNSQNGAAIDEYRVAIQLKPDVPKAHLSLGVALAWERDVNGAITEYREAVRLKPDYQEAHSYLGYELISIGKQQEGDDELKIARELKAKQPASQSMPELVKKVQPEYPEKARREHIEGQVVLQAVINKDGSVTEITVVSGSPLLSQAAIKAVKKWKYRPYLLNGEPVPVETTIVVNFSLSGIEIALYRTNSLASARRPPITLG
jgi:TonB family protein